MSFTASATQPDGEDAVSSHVMAWDWYKTLNHKAPAAMPRYPGKLAPAQIANQRRC
jgi:hypothetical protein